MIHSSDTLRRLWGKGMRVDIHKGRKYKIWQLKVFRKDGYTCCICGSSDNLTADHIKPVVLYPELIYDVSNGRTLCDKCRVKDMLKSLQLGILKRGAKPNEHSRSDETTETG